MIDWSNPNTRVSEYFTVRECLWLPSWHRLANEFELIDEMKLNLIELCKGLDKVRDFFKAPIITHCMLRPFPYNILVGGAPNSAHLMGQACDFHIQGLEGPVHCDNVRSVLVPSLESLHMRMEDRPGSDWIHVDIAPVTHSRYFKP